MKTAVEWLISRLNKQGFAQVVTDEEIEQAKEMEEKQIRKSYCDGELHFVSKQIRTSEEYYNETFKSE
jgi:predicted GNAT family acetyltransferase